MKIISLNAWGGKLLDALLDWVSEQAKEADIFCFQEIYSSDLCRNKYDGWHVDTLTHLKKSLSNFVCLSHPAQSGFVHGDQVDFEVSYGLAMFIKNKVSILKSGEIFIHGVKDGKANDPKKITPRNLQWVEVAEDGTPVTICNFHGLWVPEGKQDNPFRFAQAERINAFLKTISGPKMICGDFNLLPENESLKTIETGIKNLIKEYGITSTRSAHYPKPEKFADYFLVSPDVRIDSFKVPNIEVSDHLPLILDFGIKNQ